MTRDLRIAYLTLLAVDLTQGNDDDEHPTHSDERAKDSEQRGRDSEEQ